MGFLEDFEKEIAGQNPPRRVTFRPFDQNKRYWNGMIVIHFFCLSLLVAALYWALPCAAVYYGIHASGKITARSQTAIGHFLQVQYQNRDGELQTVLASVDSAFFDSCSDQSGIEFYYLPGFPSRLGFEGDTIQQTYPLIFVPFVFLGLLMIYGYLFWKTLKEYLLLKSGIIVHGQVKKIYKVPLITVSPLPMYWGRAFFSSVSFDFKGKQYSWIDNDSGIEGDKVLVLIHPRHPGFRQVYFKDDCSVFEVKPHSR